MTGPSTTTQAQSQQSQSSPWAPAQPLLQGILGKLGGINTDATGRQTDALNSIESTASKAPNFGGAAGGFLQGLFDNAGPGGAVAGANDKLSSELTPYASGSMVGKNTALQGQLDVAGNDAKNQIESQFAGAGRPIGTNADSAQAVSRGMMQAEAPIIAGQYNQDVQNQMGAADKLFGGTVTGATTQAGLGGAALGGAQQLPGITNQNQNTVLQAEAARQGIPLGLLQQLTSMTGGIAGLGGQNSGTGTATTTKPDNTLSTLLGAGMAGASLLSDERAKEDKVPIGMLADGQTIWRYAYKSDPAKRTHIGLLAQEVERWHPEAVTQVDGVRFVDYGKATADASAMAA